MAAVIIAPLPTPEPVRRPHLHPVPDLPVAPVRPRRPSPAVLRRRRVVAGVVLLALAALVLMASVAAIGLVRGAAPTSTASPGAPAVATPGPPSSSYVVRPGDTLWAIATRIDPDGDVRALVDALAERTGGAELRPGQAIDLDGLG